MSINSIHRTNAIMMSIHAINAIVMVSHLAIRSTDAGTTSGKARASPSHAPRKRRAKQIPIASHVRERHAAVQRDVVEAPVPDGGVRHAVSRKGHDSTDNGTGNHVVPVVELVDSERTTDKHGAENGRVNDNELPHGRVVVGKDLELGVEVQVQEDEARKSSRRMAAGERLQAVVNLVWVSGADVAGVVDLREAAPVEALVGDAGEVWLADVEEVRAEAADEPLAEDLEDGGGDERVQEAEDAVVDVPEGADADLHRQDDRDGDDGGEESGEPDGDNLLAEGVAKLGPDNLAVRKGDGERSSRCRLGFVDLVKQLAISSEYISGVSLTPRPIAPMATMVKISSQVTLSHCPKLGRECIEYAIRRFPRPPRPNPKPRRFVVVVAPLVAPGEARALRPPKSAMVVDLLQG